jgi:hypothetical protein
MAKAEIDPWYLQKTYQIDPSGVIQIIQKENKKGISVFWMD